MRLGMGFSRFESFSFFWSVVLNVVWRCSFWSYELSKRYMLAYTSESSAAAGQEMTQTQEALAVLLCGGLAGVATWVSIFPLGG